MASVDEQLQKLRQFNDDEGEISRIADDIEEQWKASPVRRDRDEARKLNKSLEEKVAKYEGLAWKSAFDHLGIKLNPQVVKLPGDVDPTDGQAVANWAANGGLIERPPDYTQEDRQAHEAIAAASAGALPPNSSVITADMVNEWPEQKINRFVAKYPDEAQAMMQDPATWKGVGLDV